MVKKKEEKLKSRHQVGIPTEASGKETKKPVKKTGVTRVAKEKETKKSKVKIPERPTEAHIVLEAPVGPEAPEALRAQSEKPAKALSVDSGSKAPVRKYFYAVGRRKESIATVRLLTRGSGQVVVNGKPFEQYFTYAEWREKAVSPLFAIGQAKNLDTEVTVSGGGVIGQAEAMRHAIARALLKLNPIFRKSLRKNGFLTRDPRMKERKKYGLKRARRAPQWSKR